MRKTIIALAAILLCCNIAVAQMTTVADTIFLAETAQDGYILSSASAIYTTSTSDVLGRTTSSNIFSSFAMFDDLSIPVGVIIDTVFIRVVATASTGTVISLIYLEDEASGTAPTTYTDYTDEVLTTAYVNWGPTGWSAGTRYSTPNLAAVMQEIINRGDYASGNDFNWLIKEGGAGINNNCSYREASYTAGSEIILYVVYHTPPSCTDALTSPSGVAKLTGVDCRLRLTRP